MTACWQREFGEHCAPEIVSASHAAPELADQDANLFLIGSGKVNPVTERFLREMQRGQDPGWCLEPAPGERSSGDYEVRLIGRLGSEEFTAPVGVGSGAGGRDDFGLILRGPHPRYPKRSVTIMAGPHSLGTGAACLAATKPHLVSEIGKALTGNVDLTTRDRALWVLVKAEATPDDHVDESRVSVLAAGVYK